MQKEYSLAVHIYEGPGSTYFTKNITTSGQTILELFSVEQEFYEKRVCVGQHSYAFFRSEGEYPARDNEGTYHLYLEILHREDRPYFLESLVNDPTWVCSDSSYAGILAAEREEVSYIAEIYTCFGVVRAEKLNETRALIVYEPQKT